MKLVKDNLTHRQRQALATRQLVVASAQKLFLEQGYVATSIEAIAADAGVAVSTVYAIFKNKRAILLAIRLAWLDQSGHEAIYEQAMHEPDARRRLELAAYATRRQWEVGMGMVRVYQSAAAVDKEAAAELQEAQTGRRSYLNSFISAMADNLRAGLDIEQAQAIFSSLSLAEVYQEFVFELGRSPDDYERWLAEALKGQLLP